MTRPLSRLVPLLAGALLAVPAPAQAGGRAASAGHGAAARVVTAIVLDVDAAHHLLRTVDARRRQAVWRVGGALRPDVRLGARVRLLARGRSASGVRVVGRARTVRFYARVVRAGGHDALRLPDGGRLHRSATGAARLRSLARLAGLDVSVSLDGLRPSQLVLVTLVVDRDSVSITLSAPDGSPVTAGAGWGGLFA